jgi:hypothetical protein
MLFHYAECRYAECHILFAVMLNIIILSVATLSVVVPHSIDKLWINRTNSWAELTTVDVAVYLCLTLFVQQENNLA